MSRLAGKVALVTGASSGIGAAIAEALAAAGCSVVGGARSFENGDVVAEPGRVCRVRMDVTSAEEVERVLGALPTLHIVVHGAGVAHFGAADSLEDRALRDMLEVHVVGAAACTRAALPALRRTRGQVVFIGSIATKVALADNPGYAAAKHGQLGYARSLAAEERPNGVRVTTLVLGATDTEAWARRPTFDRSLMIEPAEVAAIAVAVIGHETAVVDEVVITPPSGVL